MIYEGAPDFTTVNGRLRITDSKGNEVSIYLNSPDRSILFCVAASFRNSNGQLELKKEEQYFKGGHREADQYYGFGFRWENARK